MSDAKKMYMVIFARLEGYGSGAEAIEVVWVDGNTYYHKKPIKDKWVSGYRLDNRFPVFETTDAAISYLSEKHEESIKEMQGKIANLSKKWKEVD